MGIDVAVVSPSRGVPSAQYRPELDTLRFFAFLGVFVTHMLPSDTAGYARYHLPPSVVFFFDTIGGIGSFGVDVFFVLSGYLITHLLLQEKRQTGTVDLKAFYVRRILRIWPLYYGFLLVAAFISPYPWRYGLCFALLVGNWMCALHGFPRPHTAITPLWSVSVEEQFYLTWAWVVHKCSSARVVFRIAVLLLALSTILRALAWHNGFSVDFVWLSTFTRLDSITSGIMLAVLLNGKSPTFPSVLRPFICVTGICLLGIAVHITPVFACSLGALGSVAVFLSFIDRREALGALRGNAALVYLGRISYGLYVFHMFVRDAVRSFLAPHYYHVITLLLTWVAAFGLTVLVASCSYRWFEQPFLAMKNRFSRLREAAVPITQVDIPKAPATAPERVVN